MNTQLSFYILSAALIPISVLQSAELTGRLSILGTAARATQGDTGYLNTTNTLTADQQSLRIMLDNSSGQDGADKNSEWSAHLKTARIHLSDIPFNDTHSSDLFRFNKYAGDWINETGSNNSTHIGYELDRAVYKQRFDKLSLALGRQPIDWGSGRFWQPLNVFGAFAPTDLDTDFKPGIDAARLDWYPSDFSSLTAVYVFSPNDNATVDHNKSVALHYRRQIGQQSEMALLTAGVIGNTVIGASFESSWSGMGWRVEGVRTHFDRPFSSTDENSIFWIAGIDYQFENGTLLAAEWYDNSRGANNVSSLSNLQTDSLVLYGLQQHLGRRVLGISVNKDITPLLHGGYTLLASTLEDVDGKLNTSLLHQLNFNYSVSNESDILFSFQFANGRGLNQFSQVQSEFGHLPASMTVRLRYYF